MYSPVSPSRARPSSPSEYDSEELEEFFPSHPRTPRVDDHPLPEPRTPTFEAPSPQIQLEDLDLSSPGSPPSDRETAQPLPPPAQVEIIEDPPAESPEPEPIEVEPAQRPLSLPAPVRAEPSVPRQPVAPAQASKSSLLPSLLEASRTFNKYQEEANRRLAAQRKVQQATIPVSRIIQKTVHRRQTRKIRKNKEHTSFVCELCKIACPTRGQLEDHKKSKRHRRASLPESFTCHICALTLHSPDDFKRHNSGRKHRQRAQYHKNKN